jgi:hypothetical protein
VKEFLSHVKKALAGAAIAGLGALLLYNAQIVDWVQGEGEFDWRSILAGVITAVVGYLAVYYAKNKPKEPPSNPT